MYISFIIKVAPVLLLSLLPGTHACPRLCQLSLSVVGQLLSATPTMSTVLLDLGLAESLCQLATSLQVPCLPAC